MAVAQLLRYVWGLLDECRMRNINLVGAMSTLNQFGLVTGLKISVISLDP